MSMDRIAQSIREGAFPKQVSPKAQGVSRVGDNPLAILVSMSAEPTDDELRGLHDHLRNWPSAATTAAQALEALRHADIDLSILLPEIADKGMMQSVRATLSLIDEARNALAAFSANMGEFGKATE